jgi:hypothetical protein
MLHDVGRFAHGAVKHWEATVSWDSAGATLTSKLSAPSLEPITGCVWALRLAHLASRGFRGGSFQCPLCVLVPITAAAAAVPSAVAAGGSAPEEVA